MYFKKIWCHFKCTFVQYNMNDNTCSLNKNNNTITMLIMSWRQCKKGTAVSAKSRWTLRIPQATSGWNILCRNWGCSPSELDYTFFILLTRNVLFYNYRTFVEICCSYFVVFCAVKEEVSASTFPVPWPCVQPTFCSSFGNYEFLCLCLYLFFCFFYSLSLSLSLSISLSLSLLLSHTPSPPLPPSLTHSRQSPSPSLPSSPCSGPLCDGLIFYEGLVWGVYTSLDRPSWARSLTHP